MRVPSVFVAGTYDLLASAEDMRTASERIPARSTSSRAPHFLQMERPDEVQRHLLAFLEALKALGPEPRWPA